MINKTKRTEYQTGGFTYVIEKYDIQTAHKQPPFIRSLYDVIGYNYHYSPDICFIDYKLVKKPRNNKSIREIITRSIIHQIRFINVPYYDTDNILRFKLGVIIDNPYYTGSCKIIRSLVSGRVELHLLITEKY